MNGNNKKNEDVVERVQEFLKELDFYDINKICERVAQPKPKQKKKVRYDEMLIEEENKAVKSFIKFLHESKITEITEKFKKEIDNYNKTTQQILDKNRKELQQYKAQYESEKDKNVSLQEQINRLNVEIKKLEQQLKESQNQIYKLQTKFDIFDSNKELFDEFIKEFPNNSPREIMIDIQKRKDQDIALLHELNEKEMALDIMRKSMAQTAKQNKQQYENLMAKYHEVEMNHKNTVTSYEETITKLTNDISYYMKYKSENILLHNMLHRIYNLLFTELRLDRQVEAIIDDKYLGITKDDFKANIFDNEEICNYINLMIKNMHRSTSDELYREVIAYANMMIRNFLKEKVGMRFRPIEVFREIKRMVENSEERIAKYQTDAKTSKERLVEIEKENAVLKKKMETERKTFESYKRIVERVLNRKKKHESIILARNSVAGSQQINKSIIDAKGKEKKRGQKSKVTKTSVDAEKKPKSKDSKSSRSSRSSSEDKKSESSEKSYSVLDEKDAKEFLDIKEGKNNNKLLKTHGCQGFINNINGIKELVEHTNRIFMYKSKMTSLHKPLRKEKLIENRFRLITSPNPEPQKDQLKDKIISNLDNVIKKFNMID